MDELQIYQSEDGALSIDVRVDNETIWLTQSQMAELFDTKRPAITKHLGNIFKSDELPESSVCSILELTAADGKVYRTKHYNLDAIVSVGYRVNSKKATSFRQWATRTLKQHLVNGYTLDKKRLTENALELQKALELVKRTSALPTHQAMGAGLVDIITKYTNTFLWLQQYDEGLLTAPKGQTGGVLTPLEDIRKALAELKSGLMSKGEATSLFATDRNNGLSAIWGTLEQTVFGDEAYPSIESKAAHLLYFVVKNHPFTDGNKRSAAFMFVDFLNRNDRLLNENYEPVINDTGLAAITLLVAESNPKEKETIYDLLRIFYHSMINTMHHLKVRENRLFEQTWTYA